MRLNIISWILCDKAYLSTKYSILCDRNHLTIENDRKTWIPNDFIPCGFFLQNFWNRKKLLHMKLLVNSNLVFSFQVTEFISSKKKMNTNENTHTFTNLTERTFNEFVEFQEGRNIENIFNFPISQVKWSEVTADFY